MFELKNSLVLKKDKEKEILDIVINSYPLETAGKLGKEVLEYKNCKKSRGTVDVFDYDRGKVEFHSHPIYRKDGIVYDSLSQADIAEMDDGDIEVLVVLSNKKSVGGNPEKYRGFWYKINIFELKDNRIIKL